MKGKFIVIEGIDGSGKTSNIRNIVNFLEHGEHSVQMTSEYNDITFCNRLRTALNEQTVRVDYCAEALTFYASRIEHTQRAIIPFLNSGTHVIADRYYHSTLAYQGLMYPEVNALHDLVKDRLVVPDLVLFLDMDEEHYLSRLKSRGFVDSIESRGIEYFRRVRSNFLSLTDDTFRVVDANRPIEDVFQETLDIVKRFLYESSDSSS